MFYVPSAVSMLPLAKLGVYTAFDIEYTAVKCGGDDLLMMTVGEQDSLDYNRWMMQGHGAAGEGQSWLPAGGDRAANQRAKSSLGAPMRRTNEPLPEGFLNAISHTHVGKQVTLVGTLCTCLYCTT